MIFFIPGSHRTASHYTWLISVLRQLREVVCLSNPAQTTVSQLARARTTKLRFTGVRRDLCFGDYNRSQDNLIDTSYFTKPCLYEQLLYHAKEYGFCGVESMLKNSILVGHSQGAGHAAYLACFYNVKGILLLSGPSDDISDPDDCWTQKILHQNLPFIKMLVHLDDRHARACIVHSVHMRMQQTAILTDQSSDTAQAGAQLFLDCRPVSALNSHDAHTTATSYKDFNGRLLARVIEELDGRSIESES